MERASLNGRWRGAHPIHQLYFNYNLSLIVQFNLASRLTRKDVPKAQNSLVKKHKDDEHRCAFFAFSKEILSAEYD
jgi:hypothetical protein